MRWKVLGIILFAILIAAFTLANTTQVTVSFLFVKARTTLVFVILLSVLLGMILMAILWSLRAWKLRGQVGVLRKQLAQAEAELDAFRESESIGMQPSQQDHESLQEGPSS